MVGWHHWLDGHEFEQTLGNGEGQGKLVAAVHGDTKSWMWLRDWTTKIICLSHSLFFSLSLTHTLTHTPLLDSPIHYSYQVMSISCLDNCNARHLCISRTAHPVHVKFWPMKIISNVQIKLLLLSKLFPPLGLCSDSLIPREQVRTEYVTIHKMFVDSNHSPMDPLFLVEFFLFVTVNWHPHTQDTYSSLKQMRRSGCFWTVLNSLFFTSMADQPLSSAYSIICKTLK